MERVESTLPQRKSRKFRVRGRFTFLAIFGLTIVVIILIRPLWLPQLYRYLDVSQSPQKADAIVILGGGDGSREEYAAQLYHEGYASRVLISGHVDYMPFNIDSLKEQDVPESATIINDQATSTYNEAQQVLGILIDLDVDSALIVTDRFHTRRASATYERVFAGYNIELTFVSPNDDFTVDNWWKSKSYDGIILEYPKMLYYWLVYGVWSG